MRPTRRARRRREAVPKITWQIGAYGASDTLGENSAVVLVCAGRSLVSVAACPVANLALGAFVAVEKLGHLGVPARIVVNDPALLEGALSALGRDDVEVDVRESLAFAEQFVEDARTRAAADVPAEGWFLPVKAWEADLADAMFDLFTLRPDLVFGPGDRIEFHFPDSRCAFTGAVLPQRHEAGLAFVRGADALDAATRWRIPAPAPADATLLDFAPTGAVDDETFHAAEDAGLDPECGVIPMIFHVPTGATEPVVRVLSGADAWDLLCCVVALVQRIRLQASSLSEHDSTWHARVLDRAVELRVVRGPETVTPPVPAWYLGLEDEAPQRIHWRAETYDGSAWREFELDSWAAVDLVADAVASAFGVDATTVMLVTQDGELLAGVPAEGEEELVAVTDPADQPSAHLLHLLRDGALLSLGDQVGTDFELRPLGLLDMEDGWIRRLVAGEGSLPDGTDFDEAALREEFDVHADELDGLDDDGDGDGDGDDEGPEHDAPVDAEVDTEEDE